MTDLPDVLRDLVRDPVVPRDLARRVVRAHRRRRLAVTAGGVAVVAAATFATAVVARPEPDGVTSGPTARVGASGAVLAKRGEPVLFCQYVSDRTGVPNCEGLRVTATGVDLERLGIRREEGSTVWGEAYLEGVLTEGTLAVTRQGTATFPLPEERDTDRPLPCPPPAGGWPRDDAFPPGLDWIRAQNALDGVARRHPDTVHVVYDGTAFTPGISVYVVIAADPAAVEAEMRETVGDRVCLVRSRWRPSEFARVRDELAARTGDGTVGQVTDRITGSYEVVLRLEVRVHDAEVDRLVRQYPPGMIEVEPWLDTVS